MISALEYFKGCHMEKDLGLFYLGLRVKLGQCTDGTVRQIVDQQKEECSNVSCSKRETAVFRER